jgi:hypothetical protein
MLQRIVGLVNKFIAIVLGEEEGLFLFHALSRLGQVAPQPLKKVIVLLLFHIACT